VLLKAGDVLFVHVEAIGKEKYVVCLDPVQGLFFFISTDPPHNAEAGVAMGRHQHPFLRWDSYLDTASVIRLSVLDLDAQLAAKPARHKGTIRSPLRQRIKDCVKSHGILPAWQASVVERF